MVSIPRTVWSGIQVVLSLKLQNIVLHFLMFIFSLQQVVFAFFVINEAVQVIGPPLWESHPPSNLRTASSYYIDIVLSFSQRFKEKNFVKLSSYSHRESLSKIIQYAITRSSPVSLTGFYFEFSIFEMRSMFLVYQPLVLSLTQIFYVIISFLLICRNSLYYLDFHSCYYIIC